MGMKRAVKITNSILLALFFLSAVYSGLHTDSGGFAGIIGSAIWVVLSYFTFRAAGSPRGALYSWAFGLNVFGLVCIFASMFAVIVNSMDNGSFELVAIFVVLLIAAPFAFNVYALRKLKFAAESEDFELLPDDEPRSWSPDVSDVLASTSTQPASHATSSNYFVRHWRGELSLPVSYWINGSLLGIVVLVLFLLVAEAVKEWTLRSTAFTMLGLWYLLILITIWSIVGIMRSAVQHPRRGGSSGWALTAQIFTVLGAISFAGRLVTEIGPQMREFASIAFNYDSLKRVNATVASNGQSLVLHGTFGTGSYDYVSQILAAAPAVRTIVLDSVGGRLREAEQLAALVRERELNTYVEGQCLSACTYVFIAGQDRAATPNAKIGFHRPSFAGTSDHEFGLNEMLSYYRTAGISEPFLTRIQDTASDDMWYPTRDELIENGVLNRISLGGETASLSSKVRSRSELVLSFRSIPLISAIEERFPGTVDRAVDAAWAAYENGANDSEIASAGRAIISKIYPQLLKTADDAGLDGFLNLMIHQLSAARDLGPKACAMFLDSKLDVTKVFPSELIKEEMNWGLAQLNAQPLRRAAIAQAQFEAALAPLTETLDESILQVIAAPEDFIDQPKRRCDAMLAFYEAVAAQPARPRSVLLRGMFQYEQ